jgi:hypothetical protein
MLKLGGLKEEDSLYTGVLIVDFSALSLITALELKASLLSEERFLCKLIFSLFSLVVFSKFSALHLLLLLINIFFPFLALWLGVTFSLSKY